MTCGWHGLEWGNPCFRHIWFKLQPAPGFLFGALYIPPSDSPYFSPQSFATLHEYARAQDSKVMVLGDLNARMPNLDVFCDRQNAVSYEKNVDRGSNSNGRTLLDIAMQCGLKPLNHLRYNGRQYEGNFTFRQKTDWISQIDWILVNPEALPHVKLFSVASQLDLPTNHAAVTAMISYPPPTALSIKERAAMLGESAVNKSNNIKHTPRFSEIDPNSFQLQLPSTDEICEDFADPMELCDKITEALYDAAAKSRIKLGQRYAPTSSAHDRWNGLLKYGSAREVWKAIDWSGKIDSPPDVQVTPSDTQFCEFYETLLNPREAEPVYLLR